MNRTELAAQIRVALASHAMWKHHLASALLTGRAPKPIEVVRREDACAFGAWLLGSQGLDQAPSFPQVRQAHARFHQEAARALEQALAGRREDLERSLAADGDFEQASRALEDALARWADPRHGPGEPPPRGGPSGGT